MAKFVAGSRAFDMTAWDLSDFGSGTVTSDGATEVDVTGAGARFHYTLTGTGLGNFDGDGFPQSGTVTGFTMDIPGRPALVISNISISASDFMGFVSENDGDGLAAALFSGSDSFIGRDDNLVLLGFGGNDSFNILRGGDDTIQGGDGNDTINAGAAFTAADSIDGGTGTDKLHLSGDYSAGVTLGAATLTNVEDITLAAGHSYNLTLNAATATSGQSLEVYGGSLVGSQTLTLDGSAVAGDLHLVGGAGNDMLIGGAGSNVIAGGAGNNALTAGTGTNTISGGTGDDLITFSNWSSLDRVNGGQSGSDTLLLNGDFSGGVTLTGGEIKNIDTLQLAAGHSYDIRAASNLAIATINGSALGAGDSMTLDASGGTVVQTIIAGAGNDVITGGAAGSVFDISLGGEDTVTINHGTVDAGGALSAGDRLEGHENSDVLNLNGDYSVGLVFGAATITGFSELVVQSGFAYNLTENDANVAAGESLSVVSQLSAGGTLQFDGSAETDGTFAFVGGGETTDILTGGAGNDVFDFNAAGLGANARLDGGGGGDTLDIRGNEVFSTHTITGIGVINTTGNLTTADGNVLAGQTLTVNSSGHLFDGSKETDGSFILDMTGNARNTQIFGGSGDDVIVVQTSKTATIQGGGGADQITLINSHSPFQDIVVYGAASESTSAAYDTVIGFARGLDVFQLAFAVTAVDAAVTTGTLSTASFDADLANAVGTAQLGAHHAMVYTPDSGTLANDHFLVIDSNGVAGYQAGQDLVIKLDTILDTNFTTADFTTGSG
jgi:Ca2+-binding RTX toxin-like protein